MKKYIALFVAGIVAVLLGAFLKVQHLPALSDIFLLAGLIMEFAAIILLIKGGPEKKVRNTSRI